jgi:hypothetical protein
VSVVLAFVSVGGSITFFAWRTFGALTTAFAAVTAVAVAGTAFTTLATVLIG